MAKSPLLLLCGDPHGAFEHILCAVEQLSPKAVVLLGDITPARPLERELERVLSRTELWWIHGNHDTDDATRHNNLFASELKDHGLHGRVVPVQGIRVAGLGGIFRQDIWRPAASDPVIGPDDGGRPASVEAGTDGGHASLRHRSSIRRAEVLRLAAERADVLVTHEAPAGHRKGFQVITQLGQALRVYCAFHGHQHEDLHYPDGVWHGVGLRGVMTQAGQIVQAGEAPPVGSAAPLAAEVDATSSAQPPVPAGSRPCRRP